MEEAEESNDVVVLPDDKPEENSDDDSNAEPLSFDRANGLNLHCFAPGAGTSRRKKRVRVPRPVSVGCGWKINKILALHGLTFDFIFVFRQLTQLEDLPTAFIL